MACSLVSIYFDNPWLGHTIKTNCRLGVRLVSPPYFAHDSSRRMFLVLHSINWSILKTQTSVDESLDECRRVTVECRGVTRWV